MDITTEVFTIKTRGKTDIIDITKKIEKAIVQTGLQQGTAAIFAIGSTAGITTIEYEPGLVKTDIPKLFDMLAPYGRHYAHHNTWGDDNGAAHVRASLLGCSMIVPFVDAKMLLGTWQQIIYIDFDTRPRSRKIAVQITGKK
ncbi:MAG: YjbQ family protein [Nitrospiraceae bacterium]|nr:MAG: YjbQ family protein [Nitrospiraceae bacterium]